MKSAITISLVPEARGGPFVYWDDLPAACNKAAALGFDAIEIFAPGPEAIDTKFVKKITSDLGLAVAAVGTGAGWVKHKLHLVQPDESSRRKAIDFIKSIIDMGATLSAPAIIGSMQGRWGDGVENATAFEWIKQALEELGEHADDAGTVLLYEPLNRYETNMVNTTAAGVELLASLSTQNVKLLSDLFHMNIEEANIADALRLGGDVIGHIHFVDSNRRAAGWGHMDHVPIISALRDINYTDYLCAEAFPWPDSDGAARQTIDTFRKLTSLS